MTTSDTIISGLVLIGIFILAYSAIRHKDMQDILSDIKELLSGKADEVKDITAERYI